MYGEVYLVGLKNILILRKLTALLNETYKCGLIGKLGPKGYNIYVWLDG